MLHPENWRCLQTHFYSEDFTVFCRHFT